MHRNRSRSQSQSRASHACGDSRGSEPQNESRGERGGSRPHTLGQIVAEDAEDRREEQEVLEDVRSGHSGESIVERQEEEHAIGESIRKRDFLPGDDVEKQGAAPQDESDEAGSESLSSGHGDHSRSNKGGDAHSTSSCAEHDDKDLVTWGSPESMENPRNWSLHRRWAVIAIVSSYTFLSPLSSSMIAPALATISTQFDVTSTVEQSLMLSVFVLAYAIGPLFLGPLSEMFGRRIVLQISNAFFIIFTIACAVAQSRVQLSIFRFFAGLGGSAPLTIGGGTVADLMKPEERGTAMSVYSLGPLLGPAIGPLIGGWIIQQTNKWRWIFGTAAIAAGVTASIGLFILPETYAPRILGKKAARLRKETGNTKLHTIFDRNDTTWIQRFEHNGIRPFVLIGTQPVIQVLALYMMVIYGTMYLLLTVFDSIFRQQYGQSTGIASLNYISLAIGFTLGGQIGGRLIDFIYKRLRDQNGGKGRPEFKLPIMIMTSWCTPAGLIIFGWSAQYKVHWIVPNIGAAIFSIGMLTNFQCIQNYTVDTYNVYAASALAANTFLRSLAGFAVPLAGPTMFERLGYGWGCTTLAFIAGAVGIPAPIFLYKYGPWLRARSQYAATPVG